MEKKQLNLSAPLLSARRYSSPLRSSSEKKDSHSERRNGLACKKSDSNMGEVVKPGSVPFNWEHVPGKAKGGANELQLQSPQQASNTPKLPPGRSLSIVPWTSGKKSGEQKPLRSLNKLSGELKVLRPKNKLSGELIVSVPQNKSSGELNCFGPQNKLSSANMSSVARCERTKEGIEKNVDYDSENDRLTYSDALESFSINCSVSGLSGSEYLGTKPHETFSTDIQARDFMMNRFLPAAKAMTLESPQYASRKQVVAVEQPYEFKALIPITKGPPPSQNASNIGPFNGQDVRSEESEDEDNSCELPRNISVKACGFLPWFCSKRNSLHFLNPVSAMKVGTGSALSSARKIGRLVKVASSGSPSQTPTKNKVDSEGKTSELNDIDSKRNGKFRPMFYSGELQNRSSLSPYRNSIKSGTSPPRNESPHSVFRKGVGFLAIPKRVNQPNGHEAKLHNKLSNQLKGLSSRQKNMQDSGGGSPAVEKTLHRDSVAVPQSNSSSSRTKRSIDGSGNDSGATIESMSSQRRTRLDIMKARGISKPFISEAVDDSPPSLSDVGHTANITDISRHERMEVVTDGNINVSRELTVRADHQCALPPPLPKSPADSWLSRNLTSGSPRNSFSYSNLGNKAQQRKQNAKTFPSGSNWETVVKSSHFFHDHGRYSEELVPHVSQQSHTRK
ncbi:hypothetical protein Nepgr_007356 [Nepenthes gracilis]|uniref:Uncharacterized protein n=1 Tax=Nepenthes gracilis TaxID=150966 RepID=A0AAD3S719_NEPGR|nr:hypothetical protein Nepgr_007356 [Nepenthes gracilis]